MTPEQLASYQSIEPELVTVIQERFRGRIHRGCPAGLRWYSRTPMERYAFNLYPPPRYGKPGMEHLWLLRIDSRKSGTGFQYSETPMPLIEWASAKIKQERKLDKALAAAYHGEDSELIRQLEVARFLRDPITC